MVVEAPPDDIEPTEDPLRYFKSLPPLKSDDEDAIQERLNKVCPRNLPWNKSDTGYTCQGKSHTYTFAEIGIDV